ncbi:hypothetical protein ACTHTN_20140, partial [Neisseria sp. P0015.S006]
GGWAEIWVENQAEIVFQHTAARRRLVNKPRCAEVSPRFQHTAARRRLVTPSIVSKISALFQHTAARRRLGFRQADA